MRSLADRLDPYLIDWGEPGAEEKSFGLTEYVAVRLESALDHLGDRRDAEWSPRLLHGRTFGLGARCIPKRVSAIALLATPWDFHQPNNARGAMIQALKPQFEHLMPPIEDCRWTRCRPCSCPFNPSGRWDKFRAFGKSRSLVPSPKKPAFRRPGRLAERRRAFKRRRRQGMPVRIVFGQQRRQGALASRGSPGSSRRGVSTRADRYPNRRSYRAAGKRETARGSLPICAGTSRPVISAWWREGAFPGNSTNHWAFGCAPMRNKRHGGDRRGLSGGLGQVRRVWWQVFEPVSGLFDGRFCVGPFVESGVVHDLATPLNLRFGGQKG